MISPDAVAADWIGKEASWKQFVEFVATLKGESCSFFNSSLLRAWSGATSPSPPPGPGHSVGDSTGEEFFLTGLDWSMQFILLAGYTSVSVKLQIF